MQTNSCLSGYKQRREQLSLKFSNFCPFQSWKLHFIFYSNFPPTLYHHQCQYLLTKNNMRILLVVSKYLFDCPLAYIFHYTYMHPTMYVLIQSELFIDFRSKQMFRLQRVLKHYTTPKNSISILRSSFPVTVTIFIKTKHSKH